MKWLRALRERLAALFFRRRMDEAMDEELEFHLDSEARHLMQSEGLPPDAARRQARLRLGGWSGTREGVRDARGIATLESIGRDLRFASRVFRNHPGYSSTAILSLALGIGSTTLVFSVVDTILFRPLPYEDSDRLYQITVSPSGSRFGVSVPEYEAWRDEAAAFENIVTGISTRVRLVGESSSVPLSGTAVPGDFFDMLGVAPMVGRTFSGEDDRPGAGPVVILGHDVWQSAFGGEDVIGRSIVMEDDLSGSRAHTIIGIMPEDFRFNPWLGQFWIPLGLDPERITWQNPIQVYGRLDEAATPESAIAELDRLSARFAGRIPEVPEGRRSSLTSLHEVVTGGTGQLPLILLGAVALVLLVAVANVTNLLLSHSSYREAELATRLALGAGPGRIVRQLMTESLLLSALGGGAGLLAAWVLVGPIVAYLPAEVPRIGEVDVDLRIVAFAMGVSVVSAAAFSLYPAWAASRKQLTDSFSQGVGRTRTLRSSRLRSGLLVSEVALAMILCVGAGLLIRSFQELQSVEIGVAPERVLSIDLSFLGEERDIVQFYRHVKESVFQVAGVEAVALASETPMVPANNFMQGFLVDNHPVTPGVRVLVERWAITPEYFDTMGIDLLSGRLFTENDDSEAARVLVVSRSAAEQMWPNANPVGQTATASAGTQYERVYTVVGVVEDVIQGTRGRSPDEHPVYFSLLAEPLAPSRYLLVRTQGDPGPLIPALRDAVWRAFPDQAVGEVRLLRDLVYREYAAPRFRTFLLASFGGIAFLIASIGIYGVTSYTVVGRVPEIGIRLALGSSYWRLLSLCSGRSVLFVALGIGLGLVGAALTVRLIESFLFETPPTDVTTYLTVAGLFLAVGIVASWLPARQALATDPMNCLRHE